MLALLIKGKDEISQRIATLDPLGTQALKQHIAKLDLRRSQTEDPQQIFNLGLEYLKVHHEDTSNKTTLHSSIDCYYAAMEIWHRLDAPNLALSAYANLQLIDSEYPNYPYLLNRFGLCAQHQLMVTKNSKSAHEYFQQGVDQQDPEAMHLLASLYYKEGKRYLAIPLWLQASEKSYEQSFHSLQVLYCLLYTSP